jgi:deoxyribose-phosphate aldolase
MTPFTYESLAGMIDHAVLVPTLTDRELEAGCRMASAYGCASACVMPYFVGRCAELLEGTSSVACCVIGFPHGNHLTAAKVAEAQEAVRLGAKELDMVCNISKVRSGDWGAVKDDVQAVVEAGHAGGAKVKVIFETCYLDDDQKRKLCEICGEVRADWVKTSTGFGLPPEGRSAGATDDDLILMRQASPEHVQVKASGGVRDLKRLLRVKEIGCTRAGASATQAILDEARRELGLEPIRVGAASTGDTTY